MSGCPGCENPFGDAHNCGKDATPAAAPNDLAAAVERLDSGGEPEWSDIALILSALAEETQNGDVLQRANADMVAELAKCTQRALAAEHALAQAQMKEAAMVQYEIARTTSAESERDALRTELASARAEASRLADTLATEVEMRGNVDRTYRSKTTGEPVLWVNVFGNVHPSSTVPIAFGHGTEDQAKAAALNTSAKEIAVPLYAVPLFRAPPVAEAKRELVGEYWQFRGYRNQYVSPEDARLAQGMQVHAGHLDGKPLLHVRRYRLVRRGT